MKTIPKRELLNKSQSYQRSLVAVFLVAIVLACGGVLWFSRSKQAKKPTTPDISEAAKTAISEAYGFEATNNFSQAYHALDIAIGEATTNVEKAALYNEKSIAALNAKDYGLALDAAKQSEKLNPSISSAHIIAISSVQLGDKATAINYLGKQIDRMTTGGQPYIQEDIDTLKAQITALKAGL